MFLCKPSPGDLRNIKMGKSRLQSQALQFSQCGVRSEIPMEWCSAASLGYLVTYPLVLLSISNIWGWNVFLELTEIHKSWKMGLVPRDEEKRTKSKLSTKHNTLTPFIIKISLHKNFIIFENNLLARFFLPLPQNSWICITTIRKPQSSIKWLVTRT